MKNKTPTIALIGSGLQLSMCASFLAEKLQYLKPTIVAIQLPPDERESHVSFLFPPFAEPAIPLIRRELSEVGLQKITITTPASPSGFAFNFSPYGVVSDAVTFHHAYQVCRQQEADVPSYDSFLAITPPPSPGVVYLRKNVTHEYRHLAVRRGVTYVPSKDVTVVLSEDEKKIFSVQTSTRQVMTADYFIDCSLGGVVMQHLQKKAVLSEQMIPSWSWDYRFGAFEGGPVESELKLERMMVKRIGRLSCGRAEKTYIFGSPDRLCEYFERPWLANCVAIGSGFAEVPELLVDLDQILARQLVTLSWLLGVSSETTHSARYFNMLSMRDFGEAADMVNLLLRGALDQPLELTESNRRRVELFRSSAGTVKENNALISENAWTGLMHAVGYTPRNTNAVTEAIDSRIIINRTKSLLSR
ncbi:MAG: tryptophan 7-halogenase [Cellvibrionaceae bacterium]|nr:tryptophan 7-halogenase [Cellvibrionaceae bacterium]